MTRANILIRRLLPVLLLTLAGTVTAQVLDRIVAVVDEEPILMSELQQKMQLQMQQAGMQITNEQQAVALQNQVLESIIADKLLLIKAERDSLTFDPGKRDEMLRERFDRIKAMSGSVEEFKKGLEAEGMTEKEFRDKLREDVEEYLLKELVMMQVAGGIQVSQREIEEFFAQNKNSLPARPESVKIAHIVLPVLPDTAAAMKRIRTIQAELNAGGDFNELAKKYSDGPTGKSGGSLGWFNRGDMVPEFDAAVFSMEPGQVSAPVLTKFGYHIIKLHEKEKTRVNASHILIAMNVSQAAKAAVAEKLKAIKAEIAGGLPFAEAAAKYSADTTSGKNGGSLGWQELQRLPKEFIAPLKALKPGEVSDPVLSPLGYHLFQLQGRHPASAVTLKNDYDMIKNMVRNRKIMDELDKVVAALKEDVYIENRLKQE